MNQFLQEHLKILQAAGDGVLPQVISQDDNQFSYDALADLCEWGLMAAGKHSTLTNIKFLDPKITQAGTEYLAKLEKPKPDHAANTPDGIPPDLKTQVYEPWHKRPLGQFAISIVKALVVAAALFAISFWAKIL